MLSDDTLKLCFNRCKSSVELQNSPEEMNHLIKLLKAALGAVVCSASCSGSPSEKKNCSRADKQSASRASIALLCVKDCFLPKWKNHNIRVALRYDCSGGATFVPTCEMND